MKQAVLKMSSTFQALVVPMLCVIARVDAVSMKDVFYVLYVLCMYIYWPAWQLMCSQCAAFDLFTQWLLIICSIVDF